METRIIRCPSCGKSTRYDSTNTYRPFCSGRCKTADIAAWAEESFRIPQRSQSGDEEFEGEDDNRPRRDEADEN